MKIKVQAQHLQPGDVVGSGEKVESTILNSTRWPSNKVCVILSRSDRDNSRSCYWGKYTLINVERAEKLTEAQKHEAKYEGVDDEDLGVADYGP